MIRSAPDPHKLWEAERIRNPCKSRTIVTFNYCVKNVSKKTRKKFRDVIIQLLKNIRGWINKVVYIYTRSDIHYTCTFNKFGIMFSVTYILLLTKLNPTCIINIKQRWLHMHTKIIRAFDASWSNSDLFN